MPVELQFLRPLWFLALLPLLVLLVLLWRWRVQDQVWRPLVDPHLLPHLLVGVEGPGRRLPLALLALGWLLVVLALAGPVWERLPSPVFTVDAKRVILLDLSPSMNAADVPPSRLARARFEVLDLLGASREGQVALVAYGPEPFVVSPLTRDAKTIADQVPRLASDLIPVPGPRRTDRALEAAGELLSHAGAGPGAVILISDGVGGAAGDADQARAIAAARALAAAGHRVSVLAVGTAEGAPVPGAEGGFASDAGGGIRLSRLDRQGLAALARAGGGRYVEPDAGDQDTRALVDDSRRIESDGLELEGLTADQWREEGPWLLLALLPLAALAFRRGWLLPVVLLAVVSPPNPGWALDWGALWQRADQRGARALAGGDPAAAADAFADPAWRAAARYRVGDYGGALGDLAGLHGAEADYNRGNALARQGDLDAAIAAYERALEQAPDLDDARFNLELLRRLKEQQERQRQQSDAGGEGEQPQDGSEEGAPDGPEAEQSRPSQGGQGKASDQQAGGAGDGSRGGGGQESAEGSEPKGGGEAGSDDSDEGQAGAGKMPAAAGQDASGALEGDRAPGPGPGAGDLGRDALTGEAPLDPGPDVQGPGETRGGRPDQGEPGERQAAASAADGADLTPEERERQQAMEAQLRRVPDDPAGLLRQRFILQHLRREGRLP
jgi:Ca-activated chloride channel homolog